MPFLLKCEGKLEIPGGGGGEGSNPDLSLGRRGGREGYFQENIIPPNLHTWYFPVYVGVKTSEVFFCFVTIVRVRVYYVDFFAFFVLRHW